MIENLQHSTLDDELLASADYKKVMEIVDQLWQGGLIQRGAGYCFSMSDLMRISLGQKGISARTVECKVTVMGNEPPTLILIGHDGLGPKSTVPNPSSIDTHIVVITDTAIPMIIDLSIGHIRQNIPFIVARANGKGDLIADVALESSRWIYHCKESVSVPSIHQENILERIKTDKQVRKEINWLKVLIIVAIAISSLNAIRGTYDFYQVYIDDSNYWGPHHMKQLIEKVDDLEQLVKKPQHQRQ
jgi:hypothetical protein